MTTTPKPPEGYVIIVPEHGYKGMKRWDSFSSTWEDSEYDSHKLRVSDWDKKHNIYAVPISALKEQQVSEVNTHIDTEKESRRWQAFVAAMQGDWAAQENEVFGIFDLNMPKKSFEDRASIYKRAADASIAVYYGEKKEGE